MTFKILNKEEFQKFADSFKIKNFLQSSYMYDQLKSEGIECYLVGIKDSEKIVCASLIYSKYKTLNHKIFEAPKGLLIDYDDLNLLTLFTKKLQEFVKVHGGYKLVIEPYVPVISRDMDANITDNYDNRKTLANINKVGYNKLNHSNQVTWTYAIDLDKEPIELFKDFKQNTRNAINRCINKYKLIVRDLSYEELPLFKSITSKTSTLKNFQDRSLTYYQNMFKAFKDKVVFKICELDVSLYKEELSKEINDLKISLNKLSDSPKNDKKKANIKEDISNLEKRITKLNDTQSDVIPLAAAMFMLYGSEVIYLFSGSDEAYSDYYGSYRLQWEIINYAYNNHFKRYNFYGIGDITNKDSKDYGVYLFKKSFGGYVEELSLPYEIGCSSFYKFYKLVKKIKP